MAMRRWLQSGAPPWVVAAHVAGLVLVFAGERVVSTVGWLHYTLTGVGCLLVVALTALRWAATSLTHGERRTIERSLAVLSTISAGALALYLATTDPMADALGIARLKLEARHRLESAVTVAWVALTLGSLVPMLFAEYALYPMRRAAGIEWRRVRQSLVAGLTLALAATYGALFTYTAGEFGVKADFSYFRTARPSESTRKVAASAGDAVRILAFFPELNAVGVEAGAYLRDLARGLPMVEFEMSDRLLVPERARQAQVFDDGVIVIERGGRRESIALGVDMAAARPKLKSLDADVQKALLSVLRDRRTAYFTVGHGELGDSAPTVQNGGRTGQGLRRILEQENYQVRDLGAVTGLGAEVPDDASLVVVAGPQQPFLAEEVATLSRYAARGGQLFLMLDPDAKVALDPLADLLGLTISRSLLANDRIHLRRHYNDSDTTVLATNRYSSHASVSTLSRMSSRPIVFAGAGALDKKAGADGALRIDFAVRALADTFNDENGNFRFDPPVEKRDAYALAAAVSRPIGPAPRAQPAGASPNSPNGKRDGEMRAFVVADSDAVSDAALGNEGNLLLVADVVRWMGGEESFAGAVSTPEDVRIEHTKQKDLVWFYGTIFAAPALVLGAGLLYTQGIRRARRRRSRQAAAPGEPGRGPDGGQQAERAA